MAQKLDAEREARQAEQTRAAELAARLAGEQEAWTKAEQDRQTLKAELEQARASEREQGKALAAERQARRAADGRAADLKAETARLQGRAGYVDELRVQAKALQERLTAPANQNQPEAPAKTRTRKKGGQPEGVITWIGKITGSALHWI